MYQWLDRGYWAPLLPSMRDWCIANRIEVREAPETVKAVCNPELVA